MKSCISVVTPDMARQWLACNHTNRPLNERWVDSLAGAISRGEWMTTHQGVALDRDGNLLDGQHRLHAIIKANMPTKIMVSTDCDAEIFSVLDVGRKRSLRDLTGHQSNIISLVSMLWRFQLGLPAAGGGGVKVPTYSQYVDAHAVFGDLVEYAHARVTHHRKGMSSTYVYGPAVIRLMQGHDRMDQINALNRLRFEDMCPSVQALCRQLVSDTASSIDRVDLMVRVWRALDPENTNLTRIQVKETAASVADMREVVIKYANQHKKAA